MIYFTSDTHFGHRNVIKHCSRPFADVEAMNAGLIKNWNETVTPEDLVYVLGDFSFYGSTKTAAILAQLNGTKHLVRGNHDDISTAEKAQRLGFSGMSGNTLLALNGQAVILSHYPYCGDHTEVERYTERRPKDDGKTWLLHGHVHQGWLKRDRMINVGCDVWDYRPVSADRLLAIIGS